MKTTVRKRLGEEKEISHFTNKESTDNSTEKAQGKGDTIKKLESFDEKVQASKNTVKAPKSNENVELEVERTSLKRQNPSDKQELEHVCKW